LKDFSKFHPWVSFSYFMLIILFTVLAKNPVYILLSFAGAFCYRLRLAGRQSVFSIRFILPLIVFAGLFNMLFSHYGTHILFSAFGYDFMLESLIFGLSTGIMLGAVIFWFACYKGGITYGCDYKRKVYGLVRPCRSGFGTSVFHGAQVYSAADKNLRGNQGGRYRHGGQAARNKKQY